MESRTLLQSPKFHYLINHVFVIHSRGNISPRAITGTIITLVTAALVGMIGLRLLSPFAERCNDSGVFTEVCNGLTPSLGNSISNLVGPLGVIVLIVSLRVFLAVQAR